LIPRILDVRIRNYKSIAAARVRLEPFTVLVGPNGSGKSNFVDCLAFVQQCLSDSIELALKNRGGINAVRRKSGGHPTHIGIAFTLDLGEGALADYGFQIAAQKGGGFRVARERCAVRSLSQPQVAFEVREGKFEEPIPEIRPKLPPDRLALYAASNVDELRPIFDFLTSMRFYSIVPDELRRLQDPDPGLFLKRDGSNAAAVLRRLIEKGRGEDGYGRLCRLLSKVVSGLESVEPRSVAQKETLQFRQEVGLEHPWRFEALNMSDGTLRALGLLLAVYQPGETKVVAVEEPEATVHPAVMELIVQVLMDAANERQVLITTHSPDVLDHKLIADGQIRAVTTEENRTLICPLSDTSRQAVRDRLYTPGELLRVGELSPDIAAGKAQAKQLDLFGPCQPVDAQDE